MEGAYTRRIEQGRLGDKSARTGFEGTRSNAPSVSHSRLWNGRTQLTSRQLNTQRPPLADVPAVYFVSPTLNNIRRIAEVSQSQ